MANKHEIEKVNTVLTRQKIQKVRHCIFLRQGMSFIVRVGCIGKLKSHFPSPNANSK